MRARPWQVAVLCTALAFAWEWLVVSQYFHGQWSALFCTGDRFTQSPAVKAESTYLFANSYGYDGQLYHAIAHDPLDLQGTERFIDAPHLRYSRILIPAFSYLLGLGRPFWVDRAFRTLELLFLFLGVLCVSRYAECREQRVWWGAAFLLLPGVFISLERNLTDLPLCALIVAAILAEERGNRNWCWLALAAAGLDREMGLVAIAGFMLASASRRRFREAAIWGAAAIPTVAWYSYVMLHVPQPQVVRFNLSYPLASVVAALQHLQKYPLSPTVIHILHVLDVIAIAGALLGFAWGLRLWMRVKDNVAAQAVAFALFGVIASPILDYTDVYSFARQNSPLFLALLLYTVQTGERKLLWPLALVLPRSALLDTRMTLLAARNLLFR